MKRKYTVLVVDDNEINRKILVKILQPEHFVLQAENGQQALDILSTAVEKISAILLDLVMPVMDGYTFLSELKKTSSYGIPVIVTTGSNAIKNEKKANKLKSLV